MELEPLRWGDIDFRNRLILTRQKPDWKPKAGEHEITISDDLLSVLQPHRKKPKQTGNDDYVFEIVGAGKSHNMLRTELIKIARQAGIEDLTKVHTLRHTFASHLVMAGVDLPTVQKLLGHSDIETTMICVHLAPEHLSRAVNKLPLRLQDRDS